MEWTNETIIKLIHAIETYPLLWDSSHTEYKNRYKRHKTVQELGKLLNCDSTEVMRKWKTILAQYRREKKKIADSISSGSGISDIYKPRWFAYPHLNFFYGRGQRNTRICSQDEIIEQIKQDTQEDTDNEDLESPQESQIEDFKAPALKRRAVNEDPRIVNTFSVTDDLNKQMEIRQQDDDDLFAASVAMKLRKIKDERTKILVQRDIDNLLYDAIIGVSKYCPMSPLCSDSHS